MPNRSILIALLVGCAAAAGCAGAPPATDIAAVHASGLSTPTSTTTTVAAPVKSPRGNIVKQLGEPGGLCTDESCSDFLMTFTVDKIEPAVKCTEQFTPEPTNGHFIAVTVTVKTTDKLTVDQALTLGLGPYDFSVVGPDGITERTSGGYGCLKDGLMLPGGSWSPSSQYQGVILLDSKHTSGTLVLKLTSAPGAGWEWTF